MTTTIHRHAEALSGEGAGTTGYELSRREDGVFMLRTWATRHNRTTTVPVYFTLIDLEALFDSIGQVLVDENMDRLTQLMEAM